MGECTTEESEWNREHLLKLVDAIKSSISEYDGTRVYTLGQKNIDWKKVSFPPFSPEECQKKWKDISQKMRKILTLTELIDQAEKDISQNIEIHRIVPTRPSSIFSTENRDRYKMKHPEMNDSQLRSLLRQKYRSLSDEEKVKYVELAKKKTCKRMKQKDQAKPYQITKKRPFADVPDTCDMEEQQQIQNESCIKIPKKKAKRCVKKFAGEPKLNYSNATAFFVKKQMVLLKDGFLSENERFTMASQMWHNLSLREKETYNAKWQEIFRKFKINLQSWFKRLPEEKQKDFLTSKPTKMQYLEDSEVTELNRNDAQAAVHRPSDSEDEDIEDSSSDEEDNSCDMEVMEEEDDDSVAFEVF